MRDAKWLKKHERPESRGSRFSIRKMMMHDVVHAEPTLNFINTESKGLEGGRRDGEMRYRKAVEAIRADKVDDLKHEIVLAASRAWVEEAHNSRHETLFHQCVTHKAYACAKFMIDENYDVWHAYRTNKRNSLKRACEQVTQDARLWQYKADFCDVIDKALALHKRSLVKRRSKPLKPKQNWDTVRAAVALQAQLKAKQQQRSDLMMPEDERPGDDYEATPPTSPHRVNVRLDKIKGMMRFKSRTKRSTKRSTTLEISQTSTSDVTNIKRRPPSAKRPRIHKTRPSRDRPSRGRTVDFADAWRSSSLTAIPPPPEPKHEDPNTTCSWLLETDFVQPQDHREVLPSQPTSTSSTSSFMDCFWPPRPTSDDAHFELAYEEAKPVAASPDVPALPSHVMVSPALSAASPHLSVATSPAMSQLTSPSFSVILGDKSDPIPTTVDL